MGLPGSAEAGVEAVLTGHLVDVLSNTALGGAVYTHAEQLRGEPREGIKSAVTRAPFGYLFWQLLALAAAGVVCGRITANMAIAIVAGGLVYAAPVRRSSLLAAPGGGAGQGRLPQVDGAVQGGRPAQ